MTDADKLRVSGSGERWRIDGGWPEADLQLCNDYLSYLADRRYSPASVRAYAFDLLHFARWLAGEDTSLDAVDTDALLRYLAACRAEHREGQHGTVTSPAGGRAPGIAPATTNRRPEPDPGPVGASAGRMVGSGPRSGEVVGLGVADVDIGRGWVRVTGKGDKERRVPLGPDVAGLIQSYLLAGRPETSSRALFIVAKGPHRGQPLTAAGLRRVFRYHREISGVAAGHPHALRHSFGTALAEAGVDLPVLQALMGHDHVDSSAAYIHLAPAHVRAAYDAARDRQRAWQAGR